MFSREEGRFYRINHFHMVLYYYFRNTLKSKSLAYTSRLVVSYPKFA